MPWGLRSTQRNKARSPALIDPCEMFDLPLASTCYAHPYSGHTDKGAHTVYHPPLMPIIGVRARPSDSQAPTAPLATVARPRLDVRQAGDGGVWAACVGEFRLSCLTGLPLSCPRRVDLVKAVNKSRLSCVGTGLESAEYCRSSVSRPLETVSGGLEVCVARRRDSERVLKSGSHWGVRPYLRSSLQLVFCPSLVPFTFLYIVVFPCTLLHLSLVAFVTYSYHYVPLPPVSPLPPQPLLALSSAPHSPIHLRVCNVYNRCGHAENLVGPPISALFALNSPIANSPTNW